MALPSETLTFDRGADLVALPSEAIAGINGGHYAALSTREAAQSQELARPKERYRAHLDLDIFLGWLSFAPRGYVSYLSAP